MTPTVAMTAPNGGRTAATPRADHLIVLDLEGSGAARPALRLAARWSVRAARGRTGASTSSVRMLLHGEATDALQAADVSLRSTADTLTPEQWHECQGWIDDVSREVVYGSGRSLFPTERGIHFGELLLLSVQGNLLDFAYLARALAATLTDNPIGRCRIISADPDRAEALRELAEAHGAAADTFTIPVVRHARRLGRAVAGLRSVLQRTRQVSKTAASTPGDLPAGIGRARVLEISESTPMAQMFDAMEQHYPSLGLAGTQRIQFGGRAGTIRSTDAATVIELGRPGIVPARERGHHAAHVRRVGARVHAFRVTKPLAGRPLRAPLRTILGFVQTDTFDRLHEHLGFCEAILDAAAPRLLVVGNDRWWVGQTFVQLARSRGIPSVCIQDGLASDIVYWWWMIADHFAASSPVVAKVLREHGAASDRVALTGQPRYDGLARLRQRARGASLRADLALESDQLYVLFATQPHHDAEYVRRVVDAVLAVPGVHVLLRPHPSEPAGKYDAIISGRAARVTGQAGRDIFMLLACADLLVTEYSTVVLEGAVLGTPAVTANFDGQPPRGTYVERGLALSARTPAQLTDAVGRLLSGRASDRDRQRREEGLAALLGPVDGASGRRAAELVARVLGLECAS